MSTLVGKVEGIYYTSGRENLSIPVNEIEFSFEGMQGDKHFGLTAFALTKHPEYKEKIEVRNARQISILSVEELSSIAVEIGVPEIKAEWLFPNLLVSGIPHLTQLPPGTMFYFDGGLIIYNGGQNFPCKIVKDVILEKYPHVEEIGKKFLKAAWEKRGLLGWVEHPKKLVIGSSFEVDLPPLWKNLWD